MAKSRSVRRAALGAALLVSFLSWPAGAQVQVGPAICLDPVPINPPPPTLTPWNYERDSGEYVWGEHQFYEDPGDTVFSLARDLVSLGTQQPAAYTDVLLFNVAQFDPPEGIATTGTGTRKLMEASLENKGLQLHVNYSDALIDPAQPVRYGKPTFFQSIDGHHQNVQTNPTVPWSGFSQPFVSATRGAWGCAFQKVPVIVQVDPFPIATPVANVVGALDVQPLNPVCDDLYVTAGIGYGLADLDPDPAQQVTAAQAQTDLLMRRDPASGRWFDVAQDTCPTGPRIPVSASAGNSSGVVFRDLTGDGWADLYVGRQGDNYGGAKNVLLVNDGTGCFRDETATRIPGELSRASNEVAAIDLDQDGDLDLAVANRCARAGCGVESEDYVLLNNGTGQFTVSPIAPGIRTDSMSVALGDLNKDGWPEIVLGNAGSDGFSQNLSLSTAEDHRMEIYVNNAATGGTLNAFTDFMNPILDPFSPTFPIEHEVTAPLTQQVLLVDLFGPPTNPATLAGNAPDGWLDLVVVSHRDLLKHDSPFGASSRVYVLSNKANWTSGFPTLQAYTAFGSEWVKTVAVADFDNNGFKDLFEGRGNRWSGVLPDLHANLGSGSGATAGQPWNYNGGFIGFKSYQTMPATEHGYGFDFADVDGDGTLDALQTSRGYDYLVTGILGPNEAEHEDYASPGAGTGKTGNKRGRQIPQGMEDGVFADFDKDGDRDALLASQRTPGWPICADTTPDAIVLVNAGGGTFGYDSLFTSSTCSTEDARVNINGRTSQPQPGIADRAVAGDLDNDGDIDAIVHLFEILPAGYSGPTPLVAPSLFPNPIATYNFGWGYFQNIIGQIGAGVHWFKDVAPTQMRTTAGTYDPAWNRGLGMDVLADFDNNGALDLFTTVGFAKTAAEVTNVAQTKDLLFLNGVGTAKGILTESSATVLPAAACTDQVLGDTAYISCGSFGVAQGDVDNDGDADVAIAHYAQGARTNYPWLLINKIASTGTMVDEFIAKAVPSSFSPVIHTASTDPAGNPTPGMDQAMFPAFADLDADGDLDLIYEVVNDLPRVLLNNGTDSNGDGLITSADTPPPGTFTDVTPSILTQYRRSTDSQDLIAVDIDQDGDLDLGNDPFSDRVTFWRNDLPADSGRPVVTEIWPRVGSIRRAKIRLEGVELTGVVKVQFRFAGGVICEQAATTVIGTDGKHLDVVIPQTCPIGLAQVRVLRAKPSCGNPTVTVQRWSRQYFGYFVQG